MLIDELSDRSAMIPHIYRVSSSPLLFSRQLNTPSSPFPSPDPVKHPLREL